MPPILHSHEALSSSHGKHGHDVNHRELHRHRELLYDPLKLKNDALRNKNAQAKNAQLCRESE